MPESKPAQPLHGDDFRHRGRDHGKHFSQSAVKKQRFVTGNQKMIVGKTRRRSDLRHEHREAINAGADLVDPGFHGNASCK
jgi:hypothetical protein